MLSEISICILHSLNIASCPQQPQFIFPAPVVNHVLLKCHLTPLAISISIPCSGGHSHIPWMLPHALGNFNLYSPLQRSITYYLNVTSRPWQFQFLFPAPAVIRTFLECCLMPSVISIYISCSGGWSRIPWLFFHALGSFNLHSPFRRPLAHSLNAASCPQ